MRDPNEIKSKADFVAFIEEFDADIKNHPDGWENVTLEAFLNALGAWANDAQLGVNFSSELDRPECWSLAAMLLWAGRSYE